MRLIALALMFGIAVQASAQEKAASKKKPAVKPAAHKKASPEQIRKFNELEKKKRQ
jgi:hypothetical protein